jgi:hypothetical protein
MIEIIVVIIATGAIASLARGRGGKPVLWGALAVVGYIVTELGTAVVIYALTKDKTPSMVPLFAGWAWMGAVALFLRFGLGSHLAQPDTDWFCSNCKTMNKKSAVMCEACKETWESQQKAVAASAQ